MAVQERTSENGVPNPVHAHGLDRSQLLGVLLEHMSDSIYFKDAESRFTLINRHHARLFGIGSPDDVVGKTDFDFFSEEHARKAYEDEQVVMRTGIALVNREEKETWPDGRTTWVTSTKMPLFNNAGRVVGTFGISRDITERKRVEEELQRHREMLEEAIAARTAELRDANVKLQQEMIERQRAERALLDTERMAAIRSMAGGVAIAFNNVMHVIRSYATSIAANFIPKTRVHDEATRILEATRRGAALTERLLHISHASAPNSVEERVPLPLAQVVQESTDFVGEMFRDQNVVIQIDHPETMPVVAGNRAQFVDTLLTFLINAAEAMPGGGTVRIDGGVRRVARPPTKSAPGDFAVLRIRDTGVGMNAAIRKRIFDPFFTTKDGDKSFGLGLSIALGVVSGMGGWIRVSSRPDKGSAFHIFLPIAAMPSDVAPAPVVVDRVTGTVLLVDDEPELLASMQLALEQEGFTVLVAESAQAGVSLYGRHAGRIDITVMDGVLHQNGSARLMRRIRRAKAEADVLVTSGFSRDYLRTVLPMGAWSFLQKPYDAKQLTRSVRELLAKDAS